MKSYYHFVLLQGLYNQLNFRKNILSHVGKDCKVIVLEDISALFSSDRDFYRDTDRDTDRSNQKLLITFIYIRLTGTKKLLYF